MTVALILRSLVAVKYSSKIKKLRPQSKSKAHDITTETMQRSHQMSYRANWTLQAQNLPENDGKKFE